MEHNDIRHRLSEYIDGSVTGEERAEIDAHLKTCIQCSDALSELRKTVEHIKTIEEIDPPAWMTQKIMATVRAEAEEKKGFFQRFFLPLRIKLPIQAVAVLFLAVTAFYINETIQPTPERSEAPLHEFGVRNETPQVHDELDKLAKADAPAVRSKKVQQAPEYKALDMKLEYEKPAAPVPQERPAALAPVPAKPSERSSLGKNEAATENHSVAPQTGASAVMQEQIAPSRDKAAQGEADSATGAAEYKRGLSAEAGSTSGSGANKLDVPVQLRINQTITVASDSISLKLLNVTEDSRCPVGVRCTWEGQVTVLIKVMKQDQHIGDIRLTQRAGNHEDLETTAIDAYLLKLVKVEPYPERVASIKSSDYIVTLVISKR